MNPDHLKGRLSRSEVINTVLFLAALSTFFMLMLYFCDLASDIFHKNVPLCISLFKTNPFNMWPLATALWFILLFLLESLLARLDREPQIRHDPFEFDSRKSNS